MENFATYNGADEALASFQGAANLRKCLEVMKSMDAGFPTPDWAGGGVLAPYMVQDIDTVIKLATFQQEDLKLVKRLKRLPYEGNSTIHEYTVKDSYGARMSLGTGEGQNGPSVMANAVRGTAKCKYRAHKRPVTEVARSMNNIMGAPNAEALCDLDAAMYELGNREYWLLYGDDRYEPNNIQGLKQAAEEAHAVSGRHVVDMRGAYVDTDVLYNQISFLCDSPNFGKPTFIEMPIDVKTDIGKVLGPHVRINRSDLSSGNQGNYGIEAVGINGPRGHVPFEENVFLSPNERKLTVTTALGDAADRPSTPVISVAVHVGGGSSAPLFLDTDIGVYAYKFYAVGPGGQSVPVATGNITSQEGKSHIWTIDVPSGNIPTCYKVYRTEKGGSDFYEILTVPQTFNIDGVTPEATVVTDINEWLPNTGVAFIAQDTPDVMGWAQLLPYMKYPLAHLSPMRNNLYMIFGMSIFAVKKRISMVKNIRMGLTGSV